MYVHFNIVKIYLYLNISQILYNEKVFLFHTDNT